MLKSSTLAFASISLSLAIISGCAGNDIGSVQPVPAKKITTPHRNHRPAAASSSAYSTDLLAMGPLAYYPLNETSGTTAYDSTSNAYNGTYVGTPTLGTTGLIAGDSDTAVTFNGTNQDVTLPSLPITLSGRNIAQPMTIVGVLEATKTSGVIASYRGFGIGLSSGYVGLYDSYFGSLFANSVKVTTSSPHFVAITCSCTGANYAVKVYVDGNAAVSGNPHAYGSMTPSANSAIADAATLGYFGGVVQGVGIFQSVLTSNQICQLSVDAGFNGSCVTPTPSPTPTASPTPVPTPTPTPGPVQVTPSSVSVAVNGQVQVDADEPYGTVTVSAGTCANVPQVAQVTTPSGAGVVITVTGVMQGSCVFTVTGSNGQEVQVPVTVTP